MTATTKGPLLRRVRSDEITRALRPPVDASTLAAAQQIVERVRGEGRGALVAFAAEFGERTPEQTLILGRDEMRAALAALPEESRDTLARAADRIRVFAQAQRDAIQTTELTIPGGRAGHTVEPVASAGGYAPAGRYPLPSSVLMTAVTARVAGCERVVVASPGANPVALAAAAIADADAFLCVGGAH
ncbi:MAG: histidinol dehydrogenase, partial [Planctomycetota bacterium]